MDFAGSAVMAEVCDFAVSNVKYLHTRTYSRTMGSDVNPCPCP